MFSGAKAAATKRSSKLSEYIRKDQTKAITRITLHNGEDVGAHDKHIYGETIIVQREINALSTKLEIRDMHGKLVKSGAKATQELEHILSKFYIDVENSVTLMHQEECKAFFQNTDKNKLFHAYMSGTLLAKIKVRGEESAQHINSIKTSSDSKFVFLQESITISVIFVCFSDSEKDIKEKEEKLKRCKEAIEVLAIESGDQSQQKARHAWAKYTYQDKKNMIEAREKYEAKKKEYDTELENLRKKEDHQETKTEELRALKIEHNQLEDHLRNLDEDNQANFNRKKQLESQLQKVQEEFENAERDMRNHRSTVQTLTNEIRASKMDVNRNQEENEGDNRESELNRLQNKRDSLDAKIDEIRTKQRQLGKLFLYESQL